MAKLANGNLCHQKRFPLDRFPTASFAIRKGYHQPWATFSVGKGFQWQSLPSGICPTETFAGRNLLLPENSAKVSNGKGCNCKRYPMAEGCHLPLEAFSDVNLHGLESMVSNISPGIGNKKKLCWMLYMQMVKMKVKMIVPNESFFL